MKYNSNYVNEGSGLWQFDRNNPGFLKEMMHLVREQVLAYEKLKSREQERRIVLKTSGSIEFVAVRSIIRCEAAGRYTQVFYDDGYLLVSMHLKEVEHQLKSEQFLRCHNSHIINKFKVLRFNKNDGGFFEMINGDHVPVARARKEFVMKQLESTGLNTGQSVQED